MVGDLQGLLDGPEALDRDYRFDIVLQASGLPVEARALADIEISNLHVPFRGRIFARDETGESRFTDPSFLAAQTYNYPSHGSDITKARKNARAISCFNEMP